MQLCEQYRPHCWGEVIGQSKALRSIDLLRRRGLTGRAIWISGKSGTGKTTTARLLAEEVCGGPECWLWGDAQEIDAKGLTLADLVGTKDSLGLLAEINHLGIGPNHCRVVIINEADCLLESVLKALRTLLERPIAPIPPHVLWIFTTTREGEAELPDSDFRQLIGRCSKVPLNTQGLARIFAERAREIATIEGLNGKPLPAYVNLLNDCKGSLREALQRIEGGEMLGP